LLGETSTEKKAAAAKSPWEWSLTMSVPERAILEMMTVEAPGSIFNRSRSWKTSTGSRWPRPCATRSRYQQNCSPQEAIATPSKVFETQAALMVRALPYVAAETCFALKSGGGTSICSISAAHEMFNFRGWHNITADVVIIPIQKTGEAFEKMVKSDAKYRFCADMAFLKPE
jgi:hypothetical protein